MSDQRDFVRDAGENRGNLRNDGECGSDDMVFARRIQNGLWQTDDQAAFFQPRIQTLGPELLIGLNQSLMGLRRLRWRDSGCCDLDWRGFFWRSSDCL